MSDFNNTASNNHSRSKVKPIRKVKHLIKFIKKDGWYLDRIKGSHRHFKHPIKLGIVTVAKQPNTDIRDGTLKNTLKQAGLNEKYMQSLY